MNVSLRGICIASVALVAGIAASIATASTSDKVLYAFNDMVLFDGKFGKLAKFQQALNTALIACGSKGLAIDGRFGEETASAVMRWIACPAIGARIPPDSPARAGVVTQVLWNALLPNAEAPSVADRSQTLVLTYEATDYDRLEWNFCQNRPLWSPEDPSKPCYSNDPGSFITWGPRGATAGGGREVQWILWRIDNNDKSIIDEAFGQEATSARAFLALDADSAKHFLCSIFVDVGRRQQWSNAFQSIGSKSEARAAYDEHYLSDRSDASKIENLYRLYSELGLRPSEVDFAFFLDRATQSTPPSNARTAAGDIRSWLLAHRMPLQRANIRRAYASVFPTRHQTADRLGRDVAFFVDAIGEENLTRHERAAWKNRGRLRARDVGLQDDAEAPDFHGTPSPPGPGNDLRLDPKPACPASVLNPKFPKSK